MIGALVGRILDLLHLHPGRDQGDDAALRDLERRLAALDTRVAVRERIERERRRELERRRRGCADGTR